MQTGLLCRQHFPSSAFAHRQIFVHEISMHLREMEVSSLTCVYRILLKQKNITMKI